MRLLICDYNIELNLNIESPNCVCIENPRMYREVVGDLWSQSRGFPGKNLLSEDSGKDLTIYKNATMVLNPFAADCNEKKIIAKLYQELAQMVTDEFYEQSSALNSKAIEFLDAIADKYPYPIDYDLDLDIQALFKMYKVCFPSADEDVIDNLLNYCKLKRRICGDELFIFTNLKQIMNMGEVGEFYNDLRYEQIYVLDVESNYTYKVSEETCIIVDKDLCVIDVD